MGIEYIYKLFIENPVVSTDSRKKSNGGLFFALEGENFDGHKFAEAALKNGYDFAIISKEKYKKSDKYILVNDTLECLQKLASRYRKEFDIPFLAITGSNGKTTTKELVVSVLEKGYKIGYTKGNFNNHIGLPLTLLSFEKDIEIAVIEMGANHPGEIKELCEIGKPTHGVITNIGRAHLEGFGSFEGVVKTKKELYDYLSENNSDILYNTNVDILNKIIEEFPEKHSYGRHEDRINVAAGNTYSNPFLNGDILIDEDSYPFTSKLIGDYNKDNILTAAAVGILFNVPNNKIIEAIEEYNPDNNRSQFIETRKNKVILDAYNANPSSMKAAIENFSRADLNNKILILGDMLELGEYSQSEHENVLNLASNAKFELIFLVGSNFCELSGKDNVYCFENVDEFKKYIKINPLDKKSILIKGSRGIKLEQIVEFL